MSASLPLASTSAFGRRMALAPWTVAIRSTRMASRLAASFSRSLLRPVTRNISRNMSRQLLEAGPSVPMATEIFRFSYSAMGAMPLASFMLEAGLVIT